MKTLNLYSLLTISACTVFFSCDKVKNPFPEDLSVNTPDSGILWDDSAESEHRNNNERFILFEEYTGHTCNNCPETTEKAERFKEEFSPYMINIQIHAGDFAAPKISGDKYQTDFRTDLGNELLAVLKPKSFPRATISRIPDGSDFALRDNLWREKIEALVNTSAIANIFVKNRYDDSTGIVQNQVIVEWITAQSEALNLQMVLIEDKILDWQTDRRLPAGQQDIPDYEHNHVLRSTINGLYGQVLTLSPAGTSDTITTNFQLPTKVLDVNNCSVVAFIFKPGPDEYEVMQVNYAHITSAP